MTPAERFFKAREAWLRASARDTPGGAKLLNRPASEYTEYVLARAAWDGYNAWRDARRELGT